MRNRRRGDSPWAPVRHWFKVHQEALTILGVCFAMGLLAGTLITLWLSEPAAEQLLFPKEPEHIMLQTTPHVVEILECWSQPGILMVWSDGQVWRARSENPEDLSDWTLLSHVRLGETP